MKFLCSDKEQMNIFMRHGERFKMMLRKCPNEDIAQLSIFDTKMLLDVVAGDTMMIVDVDQAIRIFDALATTDYQA